MLPRMLGLRMPELLIILAVVVLVFGGSKIPQLGEALGKGIRNFKRATDGKDEPGDAAAPQARDARQLPTGSVDATVPSAVAEKTKA